MPSDLELKNREVWVEGDYSVSPVNLKNGRVVEGLSMLTETTIEVITPNHDADLQDFVGKDMRLVLQDKEDSKRYFTGTCISMEYIGLYQGMAHFVAETRPWLWFLTRTRENRIYQEKSVVDIFMEIMGDYGFSSDIENKLSETYDKRVYCVQYGETDFAFVSRLFEEEGIYYYFQQDDKKLKMVLADSISAHQANPDGPDIKYEVKEKSYRRGQDHIFDWAEATKLTSGKVTLNDYDFEKPKAEGKAINSIPKGKHSHKTYEDYRYPGHIRLPPHKSLFARVAMEAHAIEHQFSRGVGNVRTLGVGQTFKLKEHPRAANNMEYLIARATHDLQIETDYEDEETKKPLIDKLIKVDEDNDDTYRCTFDVLPKASPFRAQQDTPWPEIVGLQTAVVTGPSGEEIYTDKYGRIKVQFYWDRLGKKDEKTTCWVRCVMPWTGKNWGMVSIPRIGQEVVIQFEEGDPDRPICTGMLYNADTMPPYALPANMTQTGIKTRSSKQGGADNFNELVFEDLKDSEFVRLQSEKDYKEIIKNNAVITIGIEKQDPGDLTQTVYHTKTETIQTGDHIFSVDTGNQEIFVKTDHTEKIDGKADQTIKGNNTQTVSDGNYTQTIKSGNVTRDVKSGNENHTLNTGNYKLKTTAGSVTIEAGMEIKLKVGGNSITIDQSGIAIKGIMVTMDGNATVDIGSPMTTVNGDAMLTLKGGVTMIN